LRIHQPGSIGGCRIILFFFKNLNKESELLV